MLISHIVGVLWSRQPAVGPQRIFPPRASLPELRPTVWFSSCRKHRETQKPSGNNASIKPQRICWEQPQWTWVSSAEISLQTDLKPRQATIFLHLSYLHGNPAVASQETDSERDLRLDPPALSVLQTESTAMAELHPTFPVVQRLLHARTEIARLSRERPLTGPCTPTPVTCSRTAATCVVRSASGVKRPRHNRKIRMGKLWNRKGRKKGGGQVSHLFL